jgi:carbamoyl-phosphate synthase small subunit
MLGGAEEAFGEVVFTTNHTGYQEVLTDPSFAGQVVVMTAPMIGNYGTCPEEAQSRRSWVGGFVVRRLSYGAPRGREPLREYLERHAIPTLVGPDTRSITRHIRAAGAMRAGFFPATTNQADALPQVRAQPPMAGRNLATEVSTPDAYTVEHAGLGAPTVTCLDYGVKRRSLELIRDRGYSVRVLPAATSVEEILATEPAGIFISNGPGDPEAVPEAAEKIRALSDAGQPIFGICLGLQLIARAFGGRTYKLPYGHRGGNHPVRNLETGAVEITSQNHGFAVRTSDRAIDGAEELRVTHMNLNDGTIEGLAHSFRPVFAVQYHPESAPGPHDSRYLFDSFVEAMHTTASAATG